jgi:DNA polymerase II small subunit
LTSETRHDILKILVKSGLQVSPDALDYLSELESPLDAVRIVLESDTRIHPPVLSKEYVESLISLVAPETPLRFTIEKNPLDSSVGSEGMVDDFLALFKDRYDRIRQIYMARSDTMVALSTEAAKKLSSSAVIAKRMISEGWAPSRRKSCVVMGMVKQKRLSFSHNVIVELEDVQGSIPCIIPTARNRALSDKAASLLHDEVVCLSGYVDEHERMIADDVMFPDIPVNHQAGRASREVYAAFISDLHCGSLEFLEDEFDRFIAWLNGRGVSADDETMVQRTKYLFIAGDMVDGISVYPGQRENLVLTSNSDQYALLASKLRKLPSELQVFCIPGNHDACRQALPKPPVPKVLAESLYKLDNVQMLGDPSQVNVEGVRVLLTHGDSLDDMVTNLPGAKYTSPQFAMTELLKKRHLAPIYGGKTELAPLSRDWMVVDTPPDVVHFGHAHHNAVSSYKNVQIINSGTFQAQTDFMRKQGVDPTPGIVTFLNLMTGKVTLRYFMNEIVQSM